ncbi:ribosome-binding protein 1, putative [Babesia caballi]|uniref:Ribosome-binding protein 1, putative n=1 Tax=Babesia caballi TaxID=5871 RepID=A0AAV4LM25_BABCB|nr:ribosome-binding protein 1, putative [Babesia caballi]
MAHARGCRLSVPVPNTLKTALEFLDALHNNVGGPQMAVVNELGNKIQNVGQAHISATTSNMFHYMNQLRLKIIGNTKLQSYGNYKEIEASHESDIGCVNYVISILVHLLPQLVTTLEFLESRVRNFESGDWGMLHFGISGKNSELDEWLTRPEASFGYENGQLPGGYAARDLVGGFGNNLYPPLSHLVGNNNGHLKVLWQRIQGIASGYPLTESPRPSSPEQHAYAPPGSPAQSQSSSQHHGSSAQRPPSPLPREHGSQPRQPPAPPVKQPVESQPSNGGDSSTAAIGGAVGATGLVGGGAAVYFLNVGGIRTLIAG